LIWPIEDGIIVLVIEIVRLVSLVDEIDKIFGLNEG
jgi:hypothetical protein